jgi:uncharacterized protein YdeI (YjbR/CyaY-like superfamily)
MIPQIPNHYYFPDRQSFREWLLDHHQTSAEAWLLWPDPNPDYPLLPYLEAVREALCFGWVDGVEKRIDPAWKAQRFTPRRPKSRWTELNKERCRQLIAGGLMTPAGARILPNLDISEFIIPMDIMAALKANDRAWTNFQLLPAVYVRIRIDYVEECRKLPAEFVKRLNSLVDKTAEGKLFGYFLPEIGIETKGKNQILIKDLP